MSGSGTSVVHGRGDINDYHPPTGPEIAEHLEAGGIVDRWDSHVREWVHANLANPPYWRIRDEIQPGYRLVPLPPKTERVNALDAVRNYRWAVIEGGASSPAKSIFNNGSLPRLMVKTFDGHAFPIADDGTIEVLVEGP